MPLSIWKKLSLPELTPTQMILELVDRSTTSPSDIAEDVFVKVEKFHFSTNFVVIDYIVDPRVPLILERPFLRMAGALIDVYGEELTLGVDDEAITFKVGQTSRYSYNDTELNFILRKLTTIKSSIDDPPELELKDLPSHLEYAFLEGTDKLPVIIFKELKDEEKAALLKVLKSQKRAIAWKISDIKGIDPSFCTHNILMEDDFKPAVQHQRRVNPKIYEVIKKEVIKLLDAVLIYPISDSPWLNDATRKDHFLLPFMDQMLERLAGNGYYCLLDGFSGYFQIPIDPQDQEKTTFTCPYGTFAYRRMPFGLCNALNTFQRCMMSIFHDMIEETMEEKCHFMVKESIVIGHNISKSGIEVDRAKADVIDKLPHPTSVKDHSSIRTTPTLKYKRCEADAKPDCFVDLLLQEFDVIIRDKKGAKNLAADHLSRLENVDPKPRSIPYLVKSMLP
ncbi:DNA-directed DNA polymerase [Tanacetum coccineum]